MTNHPLQTNINIHKLSSKCHNYFILGPYPWQVAISSCILIDEASVNLIKQLCVCFTGGSKIIIFNTATSFMKGITLCISSLLSLGTNQMRKFIANTVLYKMTPLFHADEMGSVRTTTKLFFG